MNTRRYSLVRSRRRTWLDALPLVPMLLVALGVGGAASMALQGTGLGRWFVGPQSVETYQVSGMSLCSGSRRVTCVVDGDTFWLDGAKIRIADINTPETGSPQCAAEAALGRQATVRLAQLLNEGPFDLVSIDRDEDQYGRKLRVVERDGRSVGAILVAEGLAHEWGGRRQSWC